MRSYTHFDGLTGKPTVRMSMEQAQSVSHAGDCLADVRAIIGKVEIIADEETIKATLGEYGEWEDLESADADTLRERMVWIAGADIAEQPGFYCDDESEYTGWNYTPESRPQ